MQTLKSTISRVFSEYPVQAVLLVAAFALLVFFDIPYPLSTLLLLALMGLSFFFGGHYPPGEISWSWAGNRKNGLPLAAEFEQALAEAGEVFEAVVEKAATMIESVSEEPAPAPKTRAPRKRAAKPKNS
jgi:hypothetical protein